ncbi:MAG: hypothetical protein AAFN80_13450 [Pseudomonadota bacterium]
MRFFQVLVALTALCLSPWAFAQEGYPNSCDPSKYDECLHLAWKYENGHWPFPKDQKRTEALLQIGIEGAIEACQTGKHLSCEELLSIARDFEQIAPQEKAKLGLLAQAALEQQCEGGNAFSCEMRSTKSWHLRDVGALPETTKDALDAERKIWRNKSEATARVNLPNL